MTIHSNGNGPRARCGAIVTARRQHLIKTKEWDQVTCKRCLGSYRNPDGSTSRQKEMMNWRK